MSKGFPSDDELNEKLQEKLEEELTPLKALDELHCVAMGMKKYDDDTLNAEKIIEKELKLAELYQQEILKLKWENVNLEDTLTRYREILKKHDIYGLRKLETSLTILDNMIKQKNELWSILKKYKIYTLEKLDEKLKEKS